MVLQEVKSIEEETAGGRARFKESTAIFQPHYTDEASRPRSVQDAAPDRRRTNEVPEGFNVIPKVRRTLLDRRREVFEAGGPTNGITRKRSPLDLCFLKEFLSGCPVRIAAAELLARVTRSSTTRRRAALYSVAPSRGETGAHLRLQQSPLRSRCPRFDYGYSLDYPNMLCLWEAQSAILPTLPR